jgi:hypothetical protein
LLQSIPDLDVEMSSVETWLLKETELLEADGSQVHTRPPAVDTALQPVSPLAGAGNGDAAVSVGPSAQSNVVLPPPGPGAHFTTHFVPGGNSVEMGLMSAPPGSATWIFLWIFPAGGE